MDIGLRFDANNVLGLKFTLTFYVILGLDLTQSACIGLIIDASIIYILDFGPRYYRISGS